MSSSSEEQTLGVIFSNDHSGINPDLCRELRIRSSMLLILNGMNAFIVTNCEYYLCFIRKLRSGSFEREMESRGALLGSSAHDDDDDDEDIAWPPPPPETILRKPPPATPKRHL
jgi:hypothetical protein